MEDKPRRDYDTVWECVIPYVHDSRDRNALSLVCRRCYEIDAITRQHVTVPFCYTVTPQMLSRRFPHLQSLKLKGKPRAAMFSLIPENWGGYAAPWVEEICRSFPKMNSIHFRRMIVTDSDLEMLARARGDMLRVLKLDKCSGFSTDGLLHIARSCRNLRTLFLEESTVTDNGGDWLHELALNNKVLENLNFYMTELFKIQPEDIELIARNCPALVSMKISDCDLTNLFGFFQSASALVEFVGGSFAADQHENNENENNENENNEQLRRYLDVRFPPRLRSLGLTFLGVQEMPILFPVAPLLKKLDLMFACLDTDGHCRLLQMCVNLEVLETRNVVGDRGLQVIASSCKKLRRLRIERGEDEQGMEDEEGAVTQNGLITISQGCPELEYLAVYVSDITNEALIYIGRYLKKLIDFRLVLLTVQERIADLPLDNGVRSLLQGCENLIRFALYLRPGALTDVGLGYIGQYSTNIGWILLGCVGQSDEGLLQFSKGCPNLRKLEMRDCWFSERALAVAARQLRSLRYLWAQGYIPSTNGWDLLCMARRFWNIELINGSVNSVTSEVPAHVLAYYSFSGRRTDSPETVFCFDTNAIFPE